MHHMIRELGQIYEFVLSVLGLQSTGKSTLLAKHAKKFLPTLGYQGLAHFVHRTPFYC